MRQALLLFCCQLVSYTLITINFRAVAGGNLQMALLTDALHASISYFVIRRIATSTDAFLPWIGFLLGSLAGTAVGMRLS